MTELAEDQSGATHSATLPALLVPMVENRFLAAFVNLILIVLLSATGIRAADQDISANSIDFNRDIRPILSDKCFHCHGPDSASREADLRLDREEDAKLDRGGYAAVTPGKLDESELYRRIICDSPDERMPPEETGKKLSKKEIALLKQWIEEDAPWSLAWTYVPPKKIEPPQVKQADWAFNEIDRYLLKSLQGAKLRPNQDADKVTLLRRIYFDLIGLPPTMEQVAAFLADDRPDAYERTVDELQASPHFGERMAIYWLDLVRYADTVGYHGDQDHNIAPYRDYVINAFNANMPFDQFTREQLAGDLLPEPSLAQRIATGYNRLLQTSHEGGVQAKEYLAIYAADRVRNVSAVWMGATMGCAACHDHKFDPYTMKDFYSMQAFFADVDEASHLTNGTNSLPTRRDPEILVPSDEQKQQLASLEARLRELRKELDEISAEPELAGIDQTGSGNSDETQGVARNEAIKTLTFRIKKREQQLASLQKSIPKTMITMSIKPRTIRVLPRGNWMDDSGEAVGPAVPEFLGKIKFAGKRPSRLDLANWLTDEEDGIGGLTARVMANRFWYLLFGRGIAPVLDDLGGQGQPPSNPELLDALALEFVDSGWNVKQLIKKIVMSHAYRQSSVASSQLREKDPMNQWFARQSCYRHPAEVVRDSTLAISGLLVHTTGGASVKPYQPAGYYRHLNFPEREYQAHHDDRQWRRGVYVHWQRQFLHPMLKAFDAPSREECTAERPKSNTPLAALVLLNDPSFVESGRAFAGRILQEAGSGIDERIDFAFQQVMSRSPQEAERSLLRNIAEDSIAYYRQNPDAANKLLAVGLARLPSDVESTDLAAWTMVARTVLSANEALTRN